MRAVLYYIRQELAFLFLLLLMSCQCVGRSTLKQYFPPFIYSTDTISARQLGITPHATYHIIDTIDLHGKTLILPQNVKLCNKGGIIKNGALVGNNTNVESKFVLFDRVRILGTWNIPLVETTLFSNLDYDNSLKDVIALTNSAITNKVNIGEGHYQVSASKNGDVILSIKSNTSINIDGDIVLVPNNYPNYSIIRADGDNIFIKGKGSIRGDRSEHLSKDGEWGMGLYISGSNVIVKDLTIDDCWGDCIYVRGRCNKILIDNCKISRGRRQGVSITSAKNVKIRKCYIEDVGGTDPEYAIDVEPNKGDTVGSVVVDNIIVKRCKGGFTANGRAQKSYIDNIVVQSSTFEAIGKTAIISTTVNNIKVKKCKISQADGPKVIAFDHISNLTLTRNEIRYKKTLGNRLLGKVKKSFGIQSWPLIISECGKTNITNNSGL